MASPPPPPSPLAPLPQECLELILGCLRYDLSTLHKLLQVSRQFFQLTVPVLYKSPFRLAAAIRNPPLLASSRSAVVVIHKPEPNWDQFLSRTRLLARLLIQNLQIPPPGQQPQPQAPRDPAFSILDDNSGMENLQPLIPPFAEPSSTWLRRKKNCQSPEESKMLWPLFNPNTVSASFAEQALEESNSSSSPAPSSSSLEPCGDLISFDNENEWGGLDELDGLTTTLKSSSEKPTTTTTTMVDPQPAKHASGLLMDYFYFYTDHDHRSIQSVIRQIYPGAGRRAYTLYLSEIELAILKHNPAKVESIHIQAVTSVVPHLLAHLTSFCNLSAVELLDAVWTREELSLVHQFLGNYAATFPAATASAEAYALGAEQNHLHPYDHQQHRTQQLGRSTHRGNAIRRLKYASSRSHGDGSRIEGQEFDPIQLLQALGPGVAHVDIVHWATTTFAQLDSIDAVSLHSLKITPVMTVHEGSAFSRHEFLSRCRNLQHLDLFSSSKDMLGWAVEDWDLKHHTFSPLPPLAMSAVSSMSMSTKKQQQHLPRSLVPMRHLRIHGPRDSIVYDILRDALYGFRDSLQVLRAQSDLAHVGAVEWMDRAGIFITGKMFSRQRNLERQNRLGPSDRECYQKMHSVDSGPLLIQWSLPHLSTLELTGSIATELDPESLLFMPCLHTLCLSITQPPMRGKMGQKKEGSQGPSNLTFLPYVTGPLLQRVLLRGPWWEVTDESLWDMICPDVDFLTATQLEEGSPKWNDDDDFDSSRRADDDVFVNGDVEEEDRYSCSGTEHEQCGPWGSQLIELTVVENPLVTVPGMIELARRMSRLEVMGTDLNMTAMTPTKVTTWGEGNCRSTRGGTTTPVPSSSNHYGYDPESRARRLLFKMSMNFPWLDLGPDANHLARGKRGEKYIRSIIN